MREIYKDFGELVGGDWGMGGKEEKGCMDGRVNEWIGRVGEV